MSCSCNTPASDDCLVLEKKVGETLVVSLSFTDRTVDPPVPEDISGHTFRGSVVEAAGGAPVVAFSSETGDGVVVLSADLTGVAPGNYLFDFTAEAPSGEVTYYLEGSRLKVRTGATT